MKLKKTLPLFLVSLSLAGNSLGTPCKYSKDLLQDIDANGIEQVKINALAGDLLVNGVADGASITVQGLACTDSEKHLEQMHLDIERDGSSITITVIIPKSIRSGWNTAYAYLDLDVSLPDSIPIEIKDSSGDMDLSSVSVTSIDDSSGRIRVRNGRSDLVLDDSSGDIIIRQLNGNISLSDSSGNIRLRDIKGNVRIRRDGSGEIEISRVEKDVEIVRDGSGGIDINQVGGTVTIGSDGSGSILISNVTDNVHIGTDGSGAIQVADVGGDFSVEAKGSGQIRSRSIKGKVSIPDRAR